MPGDTGHYLNIVSSNYECTGFAISQVARKYSVTYEQSFSFGDTYNDSMTVAAFKQKVSENCNDIDQAMKDYEDAVKAQKEEQDAYDEAKVAYDEAKEAYDASLLEPSAKPTSKPTVLPSSSVPVLPQAVKPVIKANKTTVKVGTKNRL